MSLVVADQSQSVELFKPWDLNQQVLYGLNKCMGQGERSVASPEGPLLRRLPPWRRAGRAGRSRGHETRPRCGRVCFHRVFFGKTGQGVYAWWLFPSLNSNQEGDRHFRTPGFEHQAVGSTPEPMIRIDIRVQKQAVACRKC